MRASAASLLLLTTFGCRRSPTAEPREVAGVSSATGRDANGKAVTDGTSRDEAEIDPPGPPGDLAAEVAAFTDLPACVAAHRPTDPLVADAMVALGYERLIWDSCRSLEALHRTRRSPCDAILSSALQRTCLRDLAIWKGEPDLCPSEEPTAGVTQHDVRCLAAARRDVRPCAALRGTSRAACEGFVARDASRCGTDLRCVRHVLRWRPVLPTPLGGMPYAGRLTVEVQSFRGGAAGGPPGIPAHRSPAPMEFPDDAAAGAVIVRRPGKRRLVVGDLRPVFLTGARQPGGGFWVDLPLPPAVRTNDKNDGEQTLGSTEAYALWWSPDGLLSSTVGEPFRVHVTRLVDELNGPVQLTFTATVGPLEAPRQVRWNVDTWVRDVVTVLQ